MSFDEEPERCPECRDYWSAAQEYKRKYEALGEELTATKRDALDAVETLLRERDLAFERLEKEQAFCVAEVVLRAKAESLAGVAEKRIREVDTDMNMFLAVVRHLADMAGDGDCPLCTLQYDDEGENPSHEDWCPMHDVDIPALEAGDE